MDDASVDAHLFGDPSSSVLSDQLLADQEALIEESEASNEYTSRTDSDLHDMFHSSGRRGAFPRRSTSPIQRSSRLREEAKPKPSFQWDLRNLEYVSEIDDNLICAICHCPFVNPVSLRCQHVFCRSCLFEALHHQQDGKNCPTCRRPTTNDEITAVQKILNQILDDFRIRCPLHSLGCSDIITRGAISTHLDRYCGYEEIPCPSDDCDQTIPRWLVDQPCLHQTISCPDCNAEMMSLDLPSHQETSCKLVSVTCPDCDASMPKMQLASHASKCPEAIVHCNASAYGCDFADRRAFTEVHEAGCAISKLAPLIAKQNAQLKEHATALKYLQRKTAIHEEFLDSVRETLAGPGIVGLPSLPAPPSPSQNPNPVSIPSQAQHPAHIDAQVRSLHRSIWDTSDPLAPFDSTAAHLLSLHESLRQEVARVSAAVSDLDARTDTTFLNTSLRAKEEMAHRDAVIERTRVQVQWLVSYGLQQRQQRASILAGGGEGGEGSGAGARGRAGSQEGSAAGSASSAGDLDGLQRVGFGRRRSSDGAREKL